MATDDERIARAAERAGAEAIVTGRRADRDRPRGGGGAAARPAPDVVVNLQGDEPLIEPEAIEVLVAAMEPGVVMATLARPLAEGELGRAQVVKVVTDRRGDALYFSRAAIPHRRAGGASPLARAHVGIYAFTAAFLQEFAALPPGRLEGEESLEQLRALEHGHRIRVADTRYAGFGIDTPEDLERARALLAAQRQQEGGGPW